MFISNSKGLSKEAAQKIRRPFSENTGKEINWERAAEKAVEMLKANPEHLKNVGALLDTSQD